MGHIPFEAKCTENISIYYDKFGNKGFQCVSVFVAISVEPILISKGRKALDSTKHFLRQAMKFQKTNFL